MLGVEDILRADDFAGNISDGGREIHLLRAALIQCVGGRIGIDGDIVFPIWHKWICFHLDWQRDFILTRQSYFFSNPAGLKSCINELNFGRISFCFFYFSQLKLYFAKIQKKGIHLRPCKNF